MRGGETASSLVPFLALSWLLLLRNDMVLFFLMKETRWSLFDVKNEDVLFNSKNESIGF